MRALAFAACTAVGMALGVAGDFWSAEPPQWTEVGAALVLSPIAVTIGGGITTHEPWLLLFLVGGLAFWPVWGLTAWLWIAKRVPYAWLFALLWTWQGYFRVVHRFWMMMSA